MTPPFADPPLFDNSGYGPLAVPGFEYPLEQELHPEDRFTHGVREWFQEPNLTARELAMLSLIDNITDKPTWSTDVFDDKKISQLSQEAQQRPLISPKTWEWCLAELQDKARGFQSTGRVLVYNTGVVISKSDLVVDRESLTAIKDELSTLTSLYPFETTTKNVHFDPAQQTRRLVDPLMYPLIYGKSRVLAEGGTVPLNDMFKHLSKCDIAPSIPITVHYFVHRPVNIGGPSGEYQRGSEWSTNFQRLPCEVEFLEGFGTDVRITSYINGLHPRNHGLYHAIEKLVSTSVEPWNDVLIKQGYGRFPTRIKLYGISYEPPPPDFDRFTEAGKHPGSEAYYAAIEEAKAYCAQPDYNPYDSSDDEEPFSWPKYKVPDDFDAWCRSGEDLALPVRIRYGKLTHFVHPEPGTAYTYKQWKAGQAWEAIMNRKACDYRPDVEAPTAQVPHETYRVALQESFRQKGLQVIVKIDRIELNSSESRFPGSDWHVEGLHNEHIVANSMYILEEENTSEPRIDFRQETRLDLDEFDHDEYNLEAFLKVFDVHYKEQILEGSHAPPSLQRLGSVGLPVGRLLAWPNVLHHRITPFELVDKTKSGHRSFLILSLVDPSYRICSTRNVPPQDHDWWAEQALAAALPRNVGVPRELVDHIDSYTDNWPMGLKEATKLREQMAKEQKDHERDIMNRPADLYDFNLDDFSWREWPSLPSMELGSS
ncbi:hypothetical protein KCU65_g9310, partial [Aureobasidium melanogenum]